MAVTLPVWLSISMWTSTVSGEAPEPMAASVASFFSSRMSSWVGLGMTRSTTSRTMDSATPMEEMTSAFSGMEYCRPIFLAQ